MIRCNGRSMLTLPNAKPCCSGALQPVDRCLRFQLQNHVATQAYALFEEDFFVYPTERPGFRQVIGKNVYAM